MREALRAKADCACAEVMERKDGEWVTVGGMITAAKKIRARAGATMMFATLDDLEGAVEMMVFEKTLAAAEAALQLDEIVLVKGRVDHKEGGKVCVIVQERRALRPVRRRDREGPRAGGQGRRAAQAAAPRGRRRAPAGPVIEELKRICARTSPASARSCWRCTRATARGC